ncbi:hypothetical protein GMMP15_730040 [Candidatus Magnetomoraceae bacterium gMMP-15]
MPIMSTEQVKKAIEVTIKNHGYTDYGKKPCQLIGFYFEQDISKWYGIVSVKGVEDPVIYEIEDSKPDLENKHGKMVSNYNWHNRGSVWINPNYKPFPRY